MAAWGHYQRFNHSDYKYEEAFSLHLFFTSMVRFIKPLLKRRVKEKKKMRKQTLSLTLHKEGMDTVLHIKAAKEIEDFFKKASAKSGKTAKTEVSAKWVDKEEKGLTFYVKNEKLNGKVSAYGPIMDNFGNGLMDGDGRINLALLRIVGISSEDGVSVKTDELLGFQEMRQYIEQLAGWTKAFYEENLRDQDLTATISFELE